ncbi:MAG TPA: TetR/AcrR family transcriptional regulator [Anaerolineales bacterium]|nr:TetR/AcrR family transcriptional regulator [Anaerolineales bacterium]
MHTKVKTDPRVRRTRRILQEALVSLVLEKEYSAISIKDITHRAEVAYITFFRHYDGIEELLMEVLDEGLAELLRHIATLAGEADGPANELEGKLIFEYVKQKSDLFRILLKSQSVKRIRKSVIENIAAIFQNSCGFLQRPNSLMPANMASNHMATSLLALIEWWLEHKMSPPPLQMGKIYKALIIDSTRDTVIAL